MKYKTVCGFPTNRFYFTSMRILSLHHVALHVADVEKSCHFYEQVLGLSPLPRPAFSFPGAWFALGASQELHLIGERTQEVFSASRGNHFALQTDALQPWIEHFDAMQVAYLPPKQRPDGIWQLFVRDPDGYYVELTVV